MRLNQFNPHVSDAGLPKAKRDGGFDGNVDDSAADERAATNDGDNRAAAVIEVHDPHLRSHRQAAMRSGHSRVTGILKI